MSVASTVRWPESLLDALGGRSHLLTPRPAPSDLCGRLRKSGGHRSYGLHLHLHLALWYARLSSAPKRSTTNAKLQVSSVSLPTPECTTLSLVSLLA